MNYGAKVAQSESNQTIFKIWSTAATVDYAKLGLQNKLISVLLWFFYHFSSFSTSSILVQMAVESAMFRLKTWTCGPSAVCTSADDYGALCGKEKELWPAALFRLQLFSCFFSLLLFRVCLNRSGRTVDELSCQSVEFEAAFREDHSCCSPSSTFCSTSSASLTLSPQASSTTTNVFKKISAAPHQHWLH